MFSKHTEEHKVLLRMHMPMLQVPLVVISVSFSSLELSGNFTVYLVDDSLMLVIFLPVLCDLGSFYEIGCIVFPNSPYGMRETYDLKLPRSDQGEFILLTVLRFICFTWESICFTWEIVQPVS